MSFFVAIMIIVGLQTTPEPIPEPDLLIGGIPPITFPAVSSPTPIPTITPFALPSMDYAQMDIYRSLATAENMLRRIPRAESLEAVSGLEARSRAPGAITLPQVISYGRWVIERAPGELLGPFAPIAQAIGGGIALIGVLTLIYVIVSAVVFIIRAAIRIMQLVIDVVRLILDALNLAPFI